LRATAGIAVFAAAPLFPATAIALAGAFPAAARAFGFLGAGEREATADRDTAHDKAG